jgi:hypothetical protein
MKDNAIKKISNSEKADLSKRAQELINIGKLINNGNKDNKKTKRYR